MLDRFLWANVRYEVRKDRGQYFKPRGYLTDYLADEAVQAIKANRNTPFFMYLAFTAVHTPLQALKSDYDSLAKYPGMSHCDKVYGGMILALDRAVGKVLQGLEQQGLTDNTMVIFTSDNGGPSYIASQDINAPYRGWKATLFEGGVKVPMFIKYPVLLPKGKAFMPITSHVDLFPTILQMAKPPDDSTHSFRTTAGDVNNNNTLGDIDGVDLMSNMLAYAVSIPPLSNPNSPEFAAATLAATTANHSLTVASETEASEVLAPLDLLHDQLYWRSSHYEALRKDIWKLQVSYHRPKKYWLFNMQKDPIEEFNLAYLPSYKNVLKELKVSLAIEKKKHRKPLWPSLSESPVLIDKRWAETYEPGDEYIYWAN